MAVHHDALVLGDDLDEWSELGVVFCCGDVGVVQLEELPGGVGIEKVVLRKSTWVCVVLWQASV